MKSRVISILVLIITIVAACSAATRGLNFPAAASPLGASETVKGLQMVAREAPGTFVMQHGEQFLMAWPYKGQYAMAMLGKGSNDAMRGLQQGAQPLSALVKALEDAGWSYTSPTSLPAAVLGALGQYSMEAAMTGLKAIPSVLLVPVTAIPTVIGQGEAQ